MIRRFGLAALLFATAIGSLLTSGAVAQNPSEVYTDPDGRFSVPVPATWSLEALSNRLVLVDPYGDLTVTILVAEAKDARAGIDATWEIVRPGFAETPVPGGDQDVPSSAGIDETVVVTYDGGETSGQILQAFAQRVGNHVYVLIFEGSIDAAVRRNAQIQIIASDFAMSGQEDLVISGADVNLFEGALVNEFESFVDDLLIQLEVPGGSVVIVQNGAIVYSNGFGVKELGSDEPVTANTLMMIGSTTKSFTTLMMATMVDEGLFDWNTPVVEILPSFELGNPELTAQVTMENLVCACTGVPRRDLEFVFNAHELTAEGAVRSLADFTPFTDFGETFQYSNQLVAAAGFIAPIAGGGVYGDLDEAFAYELQHRVLDPLGMDRTTLSFADVVNDSDVATPHGFVLDGTYAPIPLSTEALIEPIKPAGSLWSSANELGDYLILQLNEGVAADGVEIVSAENLRHTWEPQVEISAGVSYGLGWIIEDVGGLQTIGHDGNTLGFTSALRFAPDANVGVAVLSNGQAANLFNETVSQRLLELLFDLPPASIEGVDFLIESSEEAVAAFLDSVGDRPSLAEVNGVLGTYSNDVLGDVELEWSDGLGWQLDAGEFRSELRPVIDVASDVPIAIFFDGPLAGLTIEFEVSDADRPTFEIDVLSDQYLFEVVELQPLELDPEATPIASSVAA
ncbi:hypothetical protein BH23CHL5_BH23CHL5_26740 [soil metagenome]